VCACHTRVIPAESYAGLETESQRLRAISLLQQKANSLEAEIQHRQEVQKALVHREREADRRNEDFLATLSNELRNSLAPLRAALEILKTEPCDTASGSAALSVIRRQVAQLSRLVDDLPNIGRITPGKIELCKSEGELARIVHSVVEKAQPTVCLGS
jgi:K+-sensing histidine kinase KdpD